MYLVLQNGMNVGTVWELNGTPLIIGRGDGCDIRVNDITMSRLHLRVWLDNGTARFEDLGSCNTTLINGSPADTGCLKVGDWIATGETMFKLVETPPAKPSVPNKPSLTPITLSVGKGVYMSTDKADTKVTPPTHRTVHELYDLFHLGRALGSVESISELTRLLARTLHEQFEPYALWIAWRYADNQPPQFHPLDEHDTDEPPPVDRLVVALDKREATLCPSFDRSTRKGKAQTWLIVPFVHADESLGGFVLCGRSPGRVYAEDDLNYAVGIAGLVAPHVRAVRHAEQLRRDNRALQARVGNGAQLLGDSAIMVEVRERILRAAQSTLSILILGETGTGKEIASRMLHDHSPRREGPYVVVNCAAIPENLFESEFFGHEHGAFTGATRMRQGRFEEAHGGTLFLDEIGDLSPENQARILRVIETNAFHRVGGQKLIHVDVRILAATNKSLKEPDFRADLLHRLNSVTVQMPPLRDHPGDIALLARHFLRLAADNGPVRVRGIHTDAIAHLNTHPWPGNVRELKAHIDRAALFAQTSELTPHDLRIQPAGVCDLNTPVVKTDHDLNTPATLSLAEIERLHIQKILKAANGNISAAARILGINRVTLYKRLAEYGD